MKHVYRKFTSLLLASLLLCGTAVGLVPATAASDAFTGWLTDGWTVGDENGEPVLIGHRSNSLNLLYSDPTDYMYLEFDIYMEDSYGTVDGSIGPAYKMTNGYQYFFEYNTVSKLVRIRRIGPGVDSHIGAAKSLELGLKEWHHFKVVMAQNGIQWYLNGELLYTLTDTKGDPLTGGYWCIQGYNATPRIKCLKMYNDLENAYPDWSIGGWGKSVENGENVLTGVSSAAVTQLPTKEAVTSNALSLDIAQMDSRSSVDGNMGVTYTFADGQKYFFEYNTVLKVARVRRIINGASATVGKETAVTVELNKWYNWKLAVADNCLVWYIDNVKIHEVTDTRGDDLASGIWTVQGYNATPKLKNLKLYDTDPTAAPEVADLDLEFTTEGSLAGFVASRGSVALGQGARDGALVYTLNGAGTALQSPTITAPVGDAYCARLDIKNTIFFRLKNDTDAAQLRVYFKTPAVNRYTAEHSVLVDVTPHGDWQTVYANFSACPDAVGYLRGFKVEPVGATDGTISFDAISFEREKAIYDYAGEMISCLADTETVTVKGKLDAAYAGAKVNLYELSISNWAESLESAKLLHTVTANGTDFTFSFPLQNGVVTHLSTLFICAVETPDGPVKVSDRFQIENFTDFTENPYAFTLPDRSVKVTDEKFGAVGDGFTDDTAKIQAAIDSVSGQGGGTVIVPGDDSFYGRRYVITNIKMKDNVELRIEEGAVLWQSPRVADYQYDIVYGHDIVIPGVNWTHACSCHNLPLIQGDGVENIKLTGGGIIRSVDTGGENLDSVSGATIWTGCENRLHVIPVGFFQCENIEVNNITLLRTNNYKFNLRDCENAYIGGLTVREVTCASGDGVACTIGTKHVIIDRFTFYSNDDAITLCSTYNDPRGLVWWHPNPGGDNCIEDITVLHSNIFGGHGITFIPWGTDAPNQSLQEIKDITVTDNVLSGSYSVGTWPDNPYYGKTGFDNTETDDYSPVKQIRILKNKYNSQCTLECIQATDVLTDCGITSASNFVNGDFERKKGKNGWTTGLSNWSWTLGEDGAVESVGEGRAHRGKLTGVASLYEGLHLGMGEHTFSMDTDLVSGKGQLFVRDAVSGATVATLDIPKGETKKLSLTFTVTAPASLCIGAELSEAGELTVDNAAIRSDKVTFPETFEETFEKPVAPTFDYTGWETKTEEGNSFISHPNGSGSYKLQLDDMTDAFDLRFHVRVDEVTSSVDGNVGISFCRVDSNTQYFVEYNTVLKYIQLRKFKNGVPSVLFNKSYALENGKWYQFGLSYEGGHIRFWLDGELIIDHTDKEPLGAAILTLAGYNSAMSLDNVTLSESGQLTMTDKLPLKAEVYALIFNGAGGTGTPAAQVLRKGETPDLSGIKTPTREGYTFKGWADAEGNTVELSDFAMPAADVTLTAVWEAVEADTPADTEVDTTPTEPADPDTAEPDTSTPTEPAESEISAPDTDTTADPTPDSETEFDTEKPKGGCGSVTVSCAAILCAVAGAVTLKKKKER